MQLDLSSDQEFFRETTARFLEDLVPVATVRDLMDDPQGFADDYWRRGAELGWTSLLVDEAHGGGSISGDGLADLALIAYEFGRPRRARPAAADQRRRRRPQRTVAAPPRRCHRRPARRLRRSPPGPTASAGPTTASARSPSPSAPTATTSCSTASSARSSRPDAADHLLVTGRTGDGLTQVLVPADAPGVTIRPMRGVDLTRRFSEVAFDDVRVPTSAVVGELGDAADQVERQLQLALVDRHARVGRRHAGRLRHDPRVGLRPLLVRPAAGVLPGAQAPLRRHEGVARGEPRAQRRGGRRRLGPGAGGGRRGQRGEGLRRRQRRRAAPGLRPAPRRHRRHLRARHAPLPAAPGRRTGCSTAPPPSTACASPRS